LYLWGWGVPVRTRILSIAAGALLLAAYQRADADIIRLDFSGTVTRAFGLTVGGTCGDPLNVCSILGAHYTATMTYNTAFGTFSVSDPFPGLNPPLYEVRGSGFGPTNPLLSASITIDGFGTFLNRGETLSVLQWQGTLGEDATFSPLARSQGGFVELSFGFFQTGPCPGSPCGNISTDALTVQYLSPVPIRTVGDGVPGLLSVLALGWVWRRRLNKTKKIASREARILVQFHGFLALIGRSHEQLR
jgi:hypothetical protein